MIRPWQQLLHRSHRPIPAAFTSEMSAGAVMGQAVEVWDLASQKVPFTLDKPLTIDNGTAIRSLTFISDGKFIATISDDWTVRLHPLGIEDLMSLARQRVPRELSADERRNYLHTK
jgi:hypothetical protein